MRSQDLVGFIIAGWVRHAADRRASGQQGADRFRRTQARPGPVDARADSEHQRRPPMAIRCIERRPARDEQPEDIVPGTPGGDVNRETAGRVCRNRDRLLRTAHRRRCRARAGAARRRRCRCRRTQTGTCPPARGDRSPSPARAPTATSTAFAIATGARRHEAFDALQCDRHTAAWRAVPGHPPRPRQAAIDTDESPSIRRLATEDRHRHRAAAQCWRGRCHDEAPDAARREPHQRVRLLGLAPCCSRSFMPSCVCQSALRTGSSRVSSVSPAFDQRLKRRVVVRFRRVIRHFVVVRIDAMFQQSRVNSALCATPAAP